MRYYLSLTALTVAYYSIVATLSTIVSDTLSLSEQNDFYLLIFFIISAYFFKQIGVVTLIPSGKR